MKLVLNDIEYTHQNQFHAYTKNDILSVVNYDKAKHRDGLIYLVAFV